MTPRASSKCRPLGAEVSCREAYVGAASPRAGTGYCEAAGIDATLHQLRHTHATELVNAGVSLAIIRKRLGHRNLQTPLRYAEQSDAVADAEIRAWRRRALQGPTRATPQPTKER